MGFDAYQGEDKTIIVESNVDLTLATEIEITIDTPCQIKKTLSGGHISAVTAETFYLQIDSADTESVRPGRYKVQARFTDPSSKKTNGKFQPNSFTIRDSVFVDDEGTKYYG